jgi:hypothetical protein
LPTSNSIALKPVPIGGVLDILGVGPFLLDQAWSFLFFSLRWRIFQRNSTDILRRGSGWHTSPYPVIEDHRASRLASPHYSAVVAFRQNAGRSEACPRSGETWPPGALIGNHAARESADVAGGWDGVDG